MFLALHRKLISSYGAAPAIRDHTVTQVNTHRLNSSQANRYLINLLQRDERLS